MLDFLKLFHALCIIARMSIGLFIQGWRLAKNRSIESLSDAAGISTTLLEQIEADQADPTTDTIQALASALRTQHGLVGLHEEVGRVHPIVRRDGDAHAPCHGDPAAILTADPDTSSQA